MNAKAFNEAVASKQPGDVMEISFSRDNQSHTINIRMKNKPDKRFDMKPVPSPTPLQADILKSLTTPSSALSTQAPAAP